MKVEGLMPIGSVVMLLGGEHRVMITGYAQRKVGEENKLFDYAGCLYPEGMIGPDKTILFNRESIERVFALGYTNEESLRFLEDAEAQLAEIRSGMSRENGSEANA